MSDSVKRIKILIYALFLSLIISLVGIGFKLKSTEFDLLAKTNSINSLAQEIGIIKEQNNYLNQNIDALNNTFVDLLNNSLKEKEELKNEAGALQNIKDTLVNTVNEKDLAIQNLQKKTDELGKIAELEQVKNDNLLNVLILGENQNITDTMILAIINPSNQSISLISIPRDLYVNGRKINSIYASYGIEKTIFDISSMTGVNIDKYVIVSFNAFSKFIDLLGGIDLYVKKDIYDERYPDGDNGYVVYSVTEGSHHFTGEEALMYARSRKSTSDYDRGERQQQIIQAVRTKLKITNILSDLNKTADLFNTAMSGIKTNINVFEGINYGENYQNYVIKSGNVLTPENVLIASTTMDGEFILLPRNNDFFYIKDQISQLIKN